MSTPETADGKTLGQVTFEAYRDEIGGVRPWSDVREPERQVWEATAAAVASAVAAMREPVPSRTGGEQG
jgi:hypothetical protein